MIVQYDENFDAKRDALAQEMIDLGMDPEHAQDYARTQILQQTADEAYAKARADEKARKRTIGEYFTSLLRMVTAFHRRDQ